MKNRVAFITGGGGYIGGAIARQLAAEGVRIAICDVRQEVMEDTVSDIRAAGGEAVCFAADVRRSAEIDKAMADAVAHYGRLDIMIHTAGGSARSEIRNLVDQTDEVIERVLDVNLLGAFYASRAAARIMIAQGEGGKIVNFSSTVGLNGLVGCVDYAAAKGGVMSMTKALAKELGPHKINVISVAPGIVMRPEESGGDDRALKTNVLGEKCLATDVADLVSFLVSDKARFITGQTYVIDGGRSLSMKGTD